MDTTWFLDVDRFAARTSWAHGFMHAWAVEWGAVVLAALVTVTFLRARTGAFGDGGARPVAAAIFALPAAVTAYVLALLISRIVARPFPGAKLAHVEVLLAPSGGHSLPNAAAALGGVVVVGLWISGDRTNASLALLVGLLLSFSWVYVGAAYPGDAIAGIGLGAVVAGLGWLLMGRRFVAGLLSLARTPFGFLIGAARPHREGVRASGPAAHPVTMTGTGAVRLLDEAEPRPAPRNTPNVPTTPRASSFTLLSTGRRAPRRAPGSDLFG